MTHCKRCGQDGLEWQETNGRWRLWNVEDDRWHDEECIPDPEFQKKEEQDLNSWRQKRRAYLAKFPNHRNKYDDQQGV